MNNFENPIGNTQPITLDAPEDRQHESVIYQPDEDLSVLLPRNIEGIEEIIRLFETIAQEENWQPGNQLRAYPNSSTYFGLENENIKKIIGGLQLVSGGSNEGMPCLTVWPELNLFDRTDVGDIALLALDKEHRGDEKLFWYMCVEMWRYCKSAQLNNLYAEVTPRNLRIYNRIGWPLKPVGPLRIHWGEECYPCHMTTDEVEQSINIKASKNREYQKIITQAYR